MTDKGHNKESKITAQIQASDQLTINPQTSTKLSAPSVNNQPANTQRETLKQLTSADGLKASFDEALKQQLTAKNINLVDVNLNNQDWDESTTTLSGLGKIIVQVAAMYFTGGFDVLGSAAGTQLTAQQAFTQAAITSVKSQMVSALATSAITGNSLNLDPEQMLKTALSAGASQYAMNALSIQTKYDATKDLNTNLVGGLERAGVNSVVSTAISGGSLENNLKQNLGAEALNVTTAKLANEIGANQQSLGDVGHKAAHAALGCASAKVQGKDCASGAVGAVAGEMIAEQVGQNQDLTDDDVQAISRMGTAVIAQGLGKDTQVADQAAENAIENNWSTKAHNKLLENSFNQMLNEKELELLKKASEYMDKGENQDPDKSYLHSMTDGSSNQSPEEAKQLTIEFVDRTLNEAKKLAKEGNREKALIKLGYAMHPIMDKSSPVHTDDNGNPIQWDLSNPLNWWNAIQHGMTNFTGSETSNDLTPEILKTQKEILQEMYDEVFK